MNNKNIWENVANLIYAEAAKQVGVLLYSQEVDAASKVAAYINDKPDEIKTALNMTDNTFAVGRSLIMKASQENIPTLSGAGGAMLKWLRAYVDTHAIGPHCVSMKSLQNGAAANKSDVVAGIAELERSAVVASVQYQPDGMVKWIRAA